MVSLGERYGLERELFRNTSTCELSLSCRLSRAELLQTDQGRQAVNRRFWPLC